MRIVLVAVGLLITGCASRFEREFTETYSAIKSTPGIVYCYEVKEPAEVAGTYCTVSVPSSLSYDSHRL